MKNILHISSSIDLENSASREIGRACIEQLLKIQPHASVLHRDLAVNPLPHIGPDYLQSLANPGAEALALSNELVAELKNADLLVMESPMYNFTIPSTLKAWIDHIVRSGLTFRTSENGPEGLLTKTKAILILSSGWVYSEGPAKPAGHQEPYLRTILGYMGITQITAIRAEGLALGARQRERALAEARNRVSDAVSQL